MGLDMNRDRQPRANDPTLSAPPRHPYIGAPPRFDLKQWAQKLSNACASPVPTSGKDALLPENAEKLLTPLFSDLNENFEDRISKIETDILDIPVTQNLLHQYSRVSITFDKALYGSKKENYEGLENLTSLKIQSILDKFDKNEDGFADKFTKASDADTQDDARKLLVQRLGQEKKRLDLLQNQQKELAEYISQRSRYLMNAQHAAKVRRVAGNKGMTLSSSGNLSLPKGVTLNVDGGKRFNYIRAVFLTDYRGTLYHISEDGKTHKFNPKSKSSREMFKDYARSVPDVDKVNINLGRSMNRIEGYGAGDEKTLRELRNAALDFAFDLGTGIPYDVAKKFDSVKFKAFSSLPYSVAGIVQKHDRLLNAFENTQKAFQQNPDMNTARAYVNARIEYQNYVKDVREFSKDIKDEYLTVDPIEVTFGQEDQPLDMKPNEKELYDKAKSLRTGLAHIRSKEQECQIQFANDADELYRVSGDNRFNITSENKEQFTQTMGDHFKKMHSGISKEELGRLQNDDINPSASPTLK